MADSSHQPSADHRDTGRGLGTGLMYVVFFLSGAAALIYEISWVTANRLVVWAYDSGRFRCAGQLLYWFGHRVSARFQVVVASVAVEGLCGCRIAGRRLGFSDSSHVEVC